MFIFLRFCLFVFEVDHFKKKSLLNVTTLLLFHVLVFWMQGIWGLRSQTRNWIHDPCFCWWSLFKNILCIYLCIFVCAESSSLCRLSLASECGGYSLGAACGLLVAVASLVAGHKLSSKQASVAVACGLNSCNSWAIEPNSIAVTHRLSCSAACGIFLDQGSNSCPLNG